MQLNYGAIERAADSLVSQADDLTQIAVNDLEADDTNEVAPLKWLLYRANRGLVIALNRVYVYDGDPRAKRLADRVNNALAASGFAVEP